MPGSGEISRSGLLIPMVKKVLFVDSDRKDDRTVSGLQEEFVQFVQWLLDDESRQSWFISLSSLSPNDRLIELRNKAILLVQANERDNIVTQVATLADVETYNIIRAVMFAELNK